MYKTIIVVVLLLVVALAVQLYQQNQLQYRISAQQEEAERVHTENAARALDAERARQRASGVDTPLVAVVDKIVPDMFIVPDGPPKEFDFIVDTKQMSDVTIAGHFAVSGDHTPGIEFYIFDEDDYENWIDGNGAVALYASGRRTSGEVNARITKPGRYNLVFKNPSSHAVDVNSDIQVHYEKF